MAYNFPETEKSILAFWEEKKIFEKSLEQTLRPAQGRRKDFVFYDGPPFATGTPHYGHLLQSAIKDAIPRYKTMQGFYVERQWGWDCHGLPIENIVEKELGTKSKKDIVAMGVKKFNDLCREQLFTFIHEWERVIPRFGRWADMKNPYKTMDFAYMQSEWWAFKELYKKGLVYEDYRSMHICPRCETTLSQGEVADGYKDVKDLSVTAKFKLKKEPGVSILAWTTTPWTLPGNVALAVGKDIDYVKIRVDGEIYVVAEKRAEEVMKGKQYEVLEKMKGRKLIGLEYEPLFDYYAKDEKLKNRGNGWKVYDADFVTTEDGTGIVHIASAFGTDDMALGKQKNIPFVQHVKMDGTFKPETGEFAGLDLKPRAKDRPEEIREADLTMVKYLESKRLVFSYEKYEHSYPHCWRCDTALLNYATGSWFVAAEKIKPQLLKSAKKINWVPSHIKEGRFGQWLENARDWSISRQRFWANTIPVWRCETCKKDEIFSSAEELKEASGVLVTDLHKDVVDDVTFKCGCGGLAKRIPDVLDTWFDSGSVPFATMHYPLENKSEFKNRFPADFIGEAQDQTRAWFYYQHVLAGALFQKEAFKNCIVTGIVVAEDGKKMSKKLKNYPDPTAMIDKYGADAMRLYILSSPVVQAENFSFAERGLDEIAKKNIGRLQNVLAFYQLYDNGTKAGFSSKNVLDVWIMMRLEELADACTKGYEAYQIDSATWPLVAFIDDLSVWYVRRSRDRFKEDNDDKKDALATLRYVLGQLSLLMAPAMPFLAEHVFQAVREKDEPESVHLASWPAKNKKIKTGGEMLALMQEARNVVTFALAERTAKAIKVKQPLAKLTIKNNKSSLKNREDLLALIKDEVNIKEITFDPEIAGDVVLDVNLSRELIEEGLVREIVRALQEMRKELGLTPGDKISIFANVQSPLKEIFETNRDFIMKEAKGRDMHIGEKQGESGLEKEVVLGQEKVKLGIIKN